MIRLRPIFYPLLVCLGVLIVYWPAVHAPFNTVDDLRMVNSLLNVESWSVERIFFPGGAYYYRPLLSLSFFTDLEWNGLAPGIMHFENILLHLVNALLVFTTACVLLPKDSPNRYRWALLSALVFAWHPANTESVNWISGRTDLLAGVFLFSSMFCVIRGGQSGKMKFFFLAAGLFWIACLAKEAAIFFFPPALWLLMVGFRQGHSVLQTTRTRIAPLLLFVAAAGGYFLLRGLALNRFDSGIGTVAKGLAQNALNPLDTVRIGFKVMGFYAKKLVFPWPLNFGIIQVSDGYVVVGMIVALLCIYILFRRNLAGALFLCGMALISAALLVAFGKAAWTPIAERYLYLSMMPMVLCGMLLLHTSDVGQTGRGRLLPAGVAMLLLTFGVTTVQRNLIWQDNLLLFEDTVKKSPQFLPAKSELATALIAAGRIQEAQELVSDVWTETGERPYANAVINQARSLALDGGMEEAHQVLVSALSPASKNYPALLKEIISINERWLGQVDDPLERSRLMEESLGYLLEYDKLRPQPFNHYRIGKLYLALGQLDQARLRFEQAYRLSSELDHFHAAALTLMKKIDQNEH